MTPNAVSEPKSHAVAADGNYLTLAQCRVILERLPKGHPLRKAALRDVRVLGGYARALSKEAVQLFKGRKRRSTGV